MHILITCTFLSEVSSDQYHCSSARPSAKLLSSWAGPFRYLCIDLAHFSSTHRFDLAARPNLAQHRGWTSLSTAGWAQVLEDLGRLLIMELGSIGLPIYLSNPPGFGLTARAFITPADVKVH